MGPGAAWSDVDGDGASDLLVVGGTGQRPALFLNDGTGRFRDEAAERGLAPRGAGMGALFADWDADGDDDLYLTADGANTMWRHEGPHFVDATGVSGTGDEGWGASAAAADVDLDGDLDLYVTNYLEFDVSLLPPESEAPGRRREDPLAMLPYVFPGQADVLYRNDGTGVFTDVTERAGLHHPDGKGLGAVFVDVDEDGAPDLYVANDTTPNTYWHNDGEGRFEELSLFVGLDDPRGGMGLAPADVDGDGDVDLLLTNWQLEPNALYRNNHRHLPSARRFMPGFDDIAVKAGLAQPSVGYVGWGCLLADLDDDGDRDVFVANGYTSPDYETTLQCVGQRDQLFENVTPPGALREHKDVPRWELVPDERAGPWAARELASRGLAAADADGDGDLDLVVTNNNGPLVFLRNETDGRRGGALRVRLRGPAPNPRAVGARVELELALDGADPETRAAATGTAVDGTPTRTLVEWTFAGRGYLGQHEEGVRFGLGEGRPLRLRVRWPDGGESEHPVPEGARELTIERPGN